MATQARSAEEMVRRMLVEPGLLERIKADPVKELQQLAAEVVKEVPSSPPLETDVWIYRIVVGTIGLVALIAVVGAIFISLRADLQVPDLLTAIGSAAIGALAGLLSPVSFRR